MSSSKLAGWPAASKSSSEAGTPSTCRWKTAALHSAWASLEPTDNLTYLPLGENAVVLANEVVGYRLHGTIQPDARGL